MPTLTLEQLIVEQTETEIYDTALTIARNISLPVDSWQAGDPTRSLYRLQAQQLANKEAIRAGYIRSGFLDYATGQWLKQLATQFFDVDVPDATYATTTVTLTNPTDQLYEIEEIGDLVVKNTATGKTYTNTSVGTISPGGGTLEVDVKADEAGTDSNAGVGDIDDLVSGNFAGVTCTNAAAAVGTDEQDEDTTRAQCRRKWSSISTSGPRGAYEFFALSSEHTGTTGVTRAREHGDTDTGDVTLYIAGPSGAVSAGDITAVETACATYTTPICTTLTVLSAAAVAINVTYALYVYTTANMTAAEIEAVVEDALTAAFANIPIGGDIIPPATTGSVYQSFIAATILAALEGEAFRVTVSAPAGDTALTNGQVAALGTVTPTINLVSR